MKRIHCPIHKTEELKRLLYHTQLKEKRKDNPRKSKGTNVYPDLFYCEKCKKPYQFTFAVSEVKGDKI